MGQSSSLLAAAPFDGPARLMFAVRSCEKSGRGLEERGEMEFCVEFLECIDTVLSASDGGAKGLEARAPLAGDADGGGASPLPLPRTLPPPSFRLDIVPKTSGVAGETKCLLRARRPDKHVCRSLAGSVAGARARPGQVQVAGVVVVMWEAAMHGGWDGRVRERAGPAGANVCLCLCSDGTPIAKVEHEICDRPIAKTKVAR